MWNYAILNACDNQSRDCGLLAITCLTFDFFNNWWIVDNIKKWFDLTMLNYFDSPVNRNNLVYWVPTPTSKLVRSCMFVSIESLGAKFRKPMVGLDQRTKCRYRGIQDRLGLWTYNKYSDGLRILNVGDKFMKPPSFKTIRRCRNTITEWPCGLLFRCDTMPLGSHSL